MTPQCRSPELLPLKIIATGAALPPNRVASSTLDARLGKPAGYVEKRSGIVYRYHADDDASQAELAAAALQDALARSTIPAASIDLLISASAIAVQALPCSAAHILKIAGLAPGTPGFDINSSCVSFISALQVAAGQGAPAVIAALAQRGVVLACWLEVGLGVAVLLLVSLFATYAPV